MNATYRIVSQADRTFAVPAQLSIFYRRFEKVLSPSMFLEFKMMSGGGEEERSIYGMIG